MANIYRNVFIQGLTHILGESSTSCRTCSGKTLFIRKAGLDDDHKYMQSKKSHPRAIREAITYADFAKTQNIYLQRELVTGVSAYYFAITDWFGTPRVLVINFNDWTGKPGQTIRVKARDNVGVASVSLVIRDEKGNLLEAGEAVQSDAGSPWWDYTTKSCITILPLPTIEATARDLSGNQNSFATS